MIKQDAANGELQRDYFDNTNYAADAQKQQRDYEAAKKTYRAAFEFAQNAPTLKNTAFVRFAEGLMHEKIGVCLMTEAENAAGNAEQRRRTYQTARAEFQKTLAAWSDEQSAPDKFGLSAEMTIAAEKKAAECEEKARL